MLDGYEHLGKYFGDTAVSRTAVPSTTQQSPWTHSEGLGRYGRAVKGAAGSPILNAGQLVIAGMRLTTGSNDPDRGELFGKGSAGFVGAGATLGSAYPLDDWQGSGARAYATANRQQSGRTASMAALDRDVQTVIAREAYQVAYHRGKLDDQSSHLGDLSYLTWPIALIPGVGKAMKTAFELAAVSAALRVCSLELCRLAEETAENAEQLRGISGGYPELNGESDVPDLNDAPTLPPPSTGSSGSAEPGRHVPENYSTTVLSTSLPPSTRQGASVTHATETVPPTNQIAEPAAGEASIPAESTHSPESAAEMVSAIAPAFGAMGAVVGSVIAPLAAVLTGTVAAASQSLSTMNATDVAATRDEFREPEMQHSPSDQEPGGEGTASATPGAGVGDDAGEVPPEVLAAPEASQSLTSPPAATRTPG